MILLRSGPLATAISPTVGGSLLWLTHEGVDLLRHAPADAADPLAMASFPLVPYANRIAGGRFRFDGRDVQLPRNFGDHPHSIHGVGWQRKWTATRTHESTCTLCLDHGGDSDWPWSFRAEQQIEVTAQHLSVSLSVTNMGDRPMPAGLGLHPYFLADAGTTLRFDARSLWLSTPDMLPQREVAADALGDWSRPAPVRGETLIDNAYGGWTGAAELVRGDGLRLRVSATGAPWLHLYRPPRSTDLCLEPVSHMPDAINRGQMPVLAPGATVAIAMTITIDKIDRALSQSGSIA